MVQYINREKENKVKRHSNGVQVCLAAGIYYGFAAIAGFIWMQAVRRKQTFLKGSYETFR